MRTGTEAPIQKDENNSYVNKKIESEKYVS